MDATLYNLDVGVALADLIAETPAPAEDLEPQREAA